MKTKLSVMCAVASALSAPCLALTLPSPQPSLLNVEGVAVEVFKKGVPQFNWYETKSGCLVDSNLEDPVYAYLDGDGRVTRSTTSLAHPAPKESCGLEEKLHTKALNALPSHVEKLSEHQHSYPFRSNFKQNLVVFQVSFANQAMTYDFQKDIFGNQVGSAKHYFNTVSKGNYNLVPVKETYGTNNDGFVNIQINANHPGCGGNCGQQTMRAVYDAVLRQADRYINFAAYDKNRDRYISPDELSIMFIWAGYEAATPLQTQNQVNKSVWAHKWEVDKLSVDGVTVSKYAVFGEQQMQYRGPGKATMGVMAHELGHLMLDLPDLYPKNRNTQKTIGVWGLMGGGSWNNGGATPAFMTAWSRLQSGFVKPKKVTSSTSIKTENLAEPAQIFIDPYLKEMGDYLLLENRQQSSYDRYLPGSGTLITQYRPSLPAFGDEPRALVVVNADNKGTIGADQGDRGDLFPGSTGKTVLQDSTSPSIRPSSGLKTGFTLSNINNNGGTTVASFSANAQNKSALSNVSQLYPVQYGGSNIREVYGLQKQYDSVATVLKGSTNRNHDLVGAFIKSPRGAATVKITAYPSTALNDRSLSNDRGIELYSGQVKQGNNHVFFRKPLARNGKDYLIVQSLPNGDVLPGIAKQGNKTYALSRGTSDTPNFYGMPPAIVLLTEGTQPPVDDNGGGNGGGGNGGGGNGGGGNGGGGNGGGGNGDTGGGNGDTGGDDGDTDGGSFGPFFLIALLSTLVTRLMTRTTKEFNQA